MSCHATCSQLPCSCPSSPARPSPPSPPTPLKERGPLEGPGLPSKQETHGQAVTRMPRPAWGPLWGGVRGSTPHAMPLTALLNHLMAAAWQLPQPGCLAVAVASDGCRCGCRCLAVAVASDGCRSVCRCLAVAVASDGCRSGCRCLAVAVASGGHHRLLGGRLPAALLGVDGALDPVLLVQGLGLQGRRARPGGREHEGAAARARIAGAAAPVKSSKTHASCSQLPLAA